MHDKETLDRYRPLAIAACNRLKQERIEKYNLNPIKCKECGNPMPYELLYGNKLLDRKFCSRSCSAIYNNRLRYPTNICKYCGKETRNNTCSKDCYWSNEWNKVVEEIEKTKHVPGTYWSKQERARKYFLAKYGNNCFECKLSIWNNKPIPIVLDHIDGDSQNFAISNLRLLCRNCDAQTDTFCSRNKGNGRIHRRKTSP